MSKNIMVWERRIDMNVPVSIFVANYSTGIFGGLVSVLTDIDESLSFWIHSYKITAHQRE